MKRVRPASVVGVMALLVPMALCACRPAVPLSDSDPGDRQVTLYVADMAQRLDLF